MIETSRLFLRAPTEADLASWGAMLADPIATEFIGGPQERSVKWLRTAMLKMWHPVTNGMFSVLEKATGRWIGRIGPRHTPAAPGTEIAWTLSPSAWGQGYATEGAVAAMDWAVQQLGWTEIVHVISADNVPSACVAARLGSTDQGPRPLPWSKPGLAVHLWGQTAEHWADVSRALKIRTVEIASPDVAPLEIPPAALIPVADPASASVPAPLA